MKHSNLRFYIFVLVFSFVFTNVYSQNQQFWSKVSKKEVVLEKKIVRKTESSKAIHYRLDIDALKDVLNNASKSKQTKSASNTIIQIPNSDGGFDEFSVIESSILEPDYQKMHPEIRTYVGQNVNHPSSTISFSITPQGFHAMMLSSKNGTQFIDPYTKDNTYTVYNRKDLSEIDSAFKCLVPDTPTLASKTSGSAKAQSNPTDGKLRTFRLALASTIEYSEFHWKAAGLTASSSDASKKAAVLAAMVVTMNRVNSIYQRDLAIKMTFVDNTNIIFINSDNFTNNDANLLIDESQSVINSVIGSANYDIGHTFSTGYGGLATISSPCRSTHKARGITGLTNPVGEAFDVDFVAHEMGHQFGAPHTFNGDTANCAGINRYADTAYEPGSGSTIMAYAGICSPQNVQTHGDAYFHQNSIQMIWDNITTGSSTCGQQTILANKPPVAEAGPSYTIPISTPFKLTGSSTDPDGTSTHTYTWEQYDLGIISGLPLETNTTGPLFRSFEGTTNPVRYFPKLADYIVVGGSTDWEKLPSVNRTMTFALTVRDNTVSGVNGGGQTSVDFMTVTVNSTTPFSVVNPTSWAQGSTQNIQWVVGQTANVGTINCKTVNIKLSIDGGATFPITIVSGTPNDGSYSYTIPAIKNTTQARLLIEAADNIFYDVSDFDFNISTDQDFLITNINLSPVSCGDTTATYTFDYTATNGFSETTIFSVSNLPGSATAVFLPPNRNTTGSVTMTINNLDGVAAGNYNITITGAAQIITQNKTVKFAFLNSLCASSGTAEFQTSTTSVQFNTINQSSAKPSGYSDYRSISTDVIKNSTYSLIVKVNTDGPYDVNTKAWIDWNQNCSFNDAGEEYNLGNAYDVNNVATLNSPLTIVVPANATTGNTVMRVSTGFADGATSSPTACETGFDGEVEDYTLNIVPSLATDEFDFNKWVVYPNPNTGEFIIKLNGSNSNNIQAEIYDIRGRKVFKNSYDSTPNGFEARIHVNGLESGIYLLIVNDGIKRHTEKIAIN